MITSEPTPVGGRTPGTAEPEPAVGVGPPPDAPLTVLRGARVEIDPRRARRLVIGASLVVLTAVAVVLLVAGLNKNSQATSLQQHGVPVAVTVSGCVGLLGGSGSNAAGYACHGTYTFNGRRFHEDIPGTTLLPPGTVVRGVIVPTNPALLSTPRAVAEQRASWRVFIAPAILFAIVLIVLAVVVVTSRRARAAPVGQ
jgi:hypothetical protein